MWNLQFIRHLIVITGDTNPISSTKCCFPVSRRKLMIGQNFRCLCHSSFHCVKPKDFISIIDDSLTMDWIQMHVHVAAYLQSYIQMVHWAFEYQTTESPSYAKSLIMINLSTIFECRCSDLEMSWNRVENYSEFIDWQSMHSSRLVCMKYCNLNEINENIYSIKATRHHKIYYTVSLLFRLIEYYFGNEQDDHEVYGRRKISSISFLRIFRTKTN